MLRSFLTIALSVFLLAEASAQTTPVKASKKINKTAKAADRKAKKARRVALKSTPVAPLNDGWPPLDNTQTAVASNASASASASADAGWAAADASARTSRGEIDNANVSVAPGMPLHIRTGNGLVPYSVRPSRKSVSTQTTLGN